MVHGIKKNMPNKLINLKEKIILRKRNIIETVFDYLKNKMNLEHTRHRSPINAFVHILSTFISYCLKTNKPLINYSFDLSLSHSLIPNWGNLSTIIFVALWGILSGCDDWKDIRNYCRIKKNWLSQYICLKNGIPSSDTFRRVFTLLNPDNIEHL